MSESTAQSAESAAAESEGAQSEGALPELAALLGDARRRARMSQAELATAAQVSSRTIGELERNKRKSIRYEPIVKLATALGESMRVWLDATGHAAVSEEAARALIEELNAASDTPLVVAPEARPLVSASESVSIPTIGRWLETCRRSTVGERLIVVWRSSPGAAERDELVDELVPHVDAGMGLTIAVPYPWPDEEKGAVQPDLRARLLTAYAKVEAFTHRVRAALSPERARDVHLFERTGGEGAMPPPPLWLRTWPLVLRHAGDDARPAGSVELAEWILTPTTLEPRLTWEPSGSAAAHTDEHEAQAALWGDYLGPLLHTEVGAVLAGWQSRQLSS